MLLALSIITALEMQKPQQICRGFCCVGWTGFEPATPCTPYKCATGLRHHPKPEYINDVFALGLQI